MKKIHDRVHLDQKEKKKKYEIKGKQSLEINERQRKYRESLKF